MIDTFINSAFLNFGFPATLVIIMLYGFYKIIQWVMAQHTAITIQHKEEKVCLMNIIENQTKALNQHTEQAREFHNEVKTAHEFQRVEHERLAEILKDVGESIGRINGYVQ